MRINIYSLLIAPPVIIFIFCLFLFVQFVSAQRYWVATSASNWNNTANWSTTSGGAGGASVPGSADIVYFDANGPGNCSMDFNYSNGNIATNTSGINGIDMTGYTGTITQISGNAFCIGKNNTSPPGNFATGPVLFAGGSFVGSGTSTDEVWILSTTTPVFSNTFTAGNTDFRTLSLDIVISGGSFTPSTSMWRMFPNGNTNGTLIFSGGTFNNPGAGETRIIPPGGGGTLNFTISGGAMSFYNLSFWTNASVSSSVTVNNTITATGTTHVIGGNNSPGYILFGSGSVNYTNTASTLTIGTSTPISINNLTLNLAGNLTITNSSTGGGGSGTVNFNGTGAQNFTGSATAGNGRMPNVTVTKSSGALSLINTISLMGNWTNNNSGTGSITPGTSEVGFYGSGIQTITKTSSAETFYKLTTNCTGPLTLAAGTDVTVTNTLTMTAGNYNMNGRTLQLGDGSEATLSRTAGIMYGGFFKRYINNISSVSAFSSPYDGLFPIGSSTFYRPIEVVSSVNPATAGYITASHTDAVSVSTVAYSDNLGNAIQARTDMYSTLSTSGGFAGGTYNLDVTFNDLSPVGVITDIKQGTIASPYGVGTAESPTTGTVDAPVVKRTGVTASELNNQFVAATINSPVTPIRKFYYSRKSGNWDDATVGNGTWSFTGPSGGASCDCVPISSGYVYLQDGSIVTIANPATIQSVLDISSGSQLVGTAAFTVTQDLITAGSGKFAPTAGAWTISRDIILNGTGSSTITSGSTVSGDITINGGTLTLLGTLAATGNLTVDGTLALGTNIFTYSGGTTKTIGGGGSITGTGAGTLDITTAKSISSSANLTVSSVFKISGATTVTNYGTLTLSGDLTGSVVGSTFDNRGTLNIAGTLLTTGTLTTHNGINTVNYNRADGVGQTIKIPIANYYNLTASGSGTKTFAVPGTFAVTTLLTVSGSAVLDESTNTITGVAGLTMTGTSELKMQRGAAATYPELTGSYNLTGGTVTLNQTANTPTMRGVTYYNLNFTGNQPYNMSLVTNITNDFIIQNTSRMISNAALTVGGVFYYTSTNGTTTTLANDITVGGTSFTAASGGGLDCSSKTIKVNGSSGWTKNTGFSFAQGTGTVSFEGSSNQTIGGTAATETFYNLQIVKTGGTVSFGGSKTTLNVTNNFTETTGNFNASTLTTMAVTGSATLSAGTFTAPATLNLNGNFSFSSSATFSHNSGLVVFLGGAAQTISGTGNPAFYNLKINNSSGVQMTTNISASNLLSFQSGILDLNGKIISLGTTGSIDGAFPEVASNRVFDNSASKLGTITVTRALGSPPSGLNVGNLGAVISDATTLGGSITIIRGHKQQTNGTFYGINRYYDISTTSPPSSATFRFYYIDPSEVTGYDQNTLVFYKSTDVGVTWTNESFTTRNVASDYVELTGITGFSRWTLSDGPNPLPVIWLSLDAVPKNEDVLVTWSTASEINCDYYTVERSLSFGEGWGEAGIVKAAGNSSTIRNYEFVDPTPTLPKGEGASPPLGETGEGVVYYRLKQTDFNGNYSYSAIVSVNLVSSNTLNVYPNPANKGENVFLIANDFEGQAVLIVVNDVLGKELFSKAVLAENNYFAYVLKFLENPFPSGIYLITASSHKKTYRGKLVVR